MMEKIRAWWASIPAKKQAIIAGVALVVVAIVVNELA